MFTKSRAILSIAIFLIIYIIFAWFTQDNPLIPYGFGIKAFFSRSIIVLFWMLIATNQILSKKEEPNLSAFVIGIVISVILMCIFICYYTPYNSRDISGLGLKKIYLFRLGGFFTYSIICGFLCTSQNDKIKAGFYSLVYLVIHTNNN